MGFACSLAACDGLIGIDNRYYAADDHDATVRDGASGPEASREDARDDGFSPSFMDATADSEGQDVASEDSLLDGESDADAHVDAAWDPKTPLQIAPTHLKLWLTADRGMACTSGRVTRWLDQSGNGDDAVAPQLGPQCEIAAAPHVVNGVDLPYFSAPSNGNVLDETFDVDLGFLANSEYSIFAVERRWADLPSGEYYQFILGTNVQNEANFVASDCSPSNYNTLLMFGYVYYDKPFVELSLDQYCNNVNQQVVPVSAQAPAALSVDVAILDKIRGHEIFQGTVPLAASADVSLLTSAAGGAIGRALVRTSATGIDSRFHGDIAEIVVYDAALDNASFAAVTGYLNAHWGL